MTAGMVMALVLIVRWVLWEVNARNVRAVILGPIAKNAHVIMEFAKMVKMVLDNAQLALLVILAKIVTKK